MEFYSTYYKKLAKKEKVGEKLNFLDAKIDNTLNKHDLVNIFTAQALSEEEKESFLHGTDYNKDGMITYSEMISSFLDFNINKNAAFSTEDYDFVKKKLEELQKESNINEQYKILNDQSATPSAKQDAQNRINKFEKQKTMIYIEDDIKQKEVQTGNIELKLLEIGDYINNNTLLDFDKSQKVNEREKLQIKKDMLLLKRDISTKKYDLEAVNLNIITAQQKDGAQNELSVLEQQKISKENELNISEKNLEIYQKETKIKNDKDLLDRSFIPEILKEKTRKEIEILTDGVQLLKQRKDLHSKTSALSLTRATMLDLMHQYEQKPNSSLQKQLEILNAQQLTQQKEAQKISLQVELLDKKIQLKEEKPSTKTKAELEAEITNIESQINTLAG